MSTDQKITNKETKTLIKALLGERFKEYSPDKHSHYEFKDLHIKCFVMESGQMQHIRDLLQKINAGVDLHISRDELERLIKEFKLKTGAPCK